VADYKVNLELSMIGGIGAALAAVSSKLWEIHRVERDINRGFSQWSNFFVMAGAALAASGIVAAMDKLANAGGKLYDVQKSLIMQGKDLSTIAQGYNAAAEATSKIKGFTVSQGLTEWQKLGMVTGHPEAATQWLPDMLKFAKVLQTGERAMDAEAALRSTTVVMKALEQMGLIGTGRDVEAHKVLEGLTKDFIAQKGLVSPEQWAQTILYSRAAKYGFASPEALAMPHPFITGILPHFIQEMSGGAMGGGGGGLRGAGPLLANEYRKLVQGILSKQSKAMLLEFGLAEGDIGGGRERDKFRRRGLFFGRERYLPGGFKLHGDELAMRNPYEWVQQYLMPSLTARGVTSSEDIARVISQMMGTGLSSEAAINFALQGRARLGEQSPYERILKLQDQAMGLPEAAAAADLMNRTATTNFTASLSRLMEIIGKVITPERVSILNQLADVFIRIGNIADKPENQRAIQNITAAFAGLAVALGSTALLTGTAMLLRFLGPRGIFVGTLTAIAAAAPGVSAALGDLLRALTMKDGDIKAASAKLGDELLKLLAEFTGLLIGGLDKIAAVVRDKIQNLFGPGWHWGIVPPESVSPEQRKFYEPHKPGYVPGPGGTWVPPQVPLPQSFMAPMASPMLQPAGWIPPASSSRPLNVHNVINLDGNAIARAVNAYAIAALEHPRQAGYFDARANFPSPDGQFSAV
jgi:hypothetical protein